MKPITEEQRQALITHARVYLAAGVKSKTDKLVAIALASLTAEPVGYAVSMTYINGGLTEARVSMCNPGIPATLHYVYTTPPVPVIKLPEYQKLLDHPAVMSRWNQCIDEVKRLNGIDD